MKPAEDDVQRAALNYGRIARCMVITLGGDVSKLGNAKVAEPKLKRPGDELGNEREPKRSAPSPDVFVIVKQSDIARVSDKIELLQERNENRRLRAISTLASLEENPAESKKVWTKKLAKANDTRRELNVIHSYLSKIYSGSE